jgi:DNA-binding response OmpR family regulator
MGIAAVVPQPLDGVRLLWVDDDPDTREAVTAGLRHLGAKVVEAGSAQVAMLCFERDRPHVILLDLELPDASGWDLLKAIRRLPSEARHRTPAIALSGHNTLDDRLASLRAGFALHLGKPADPTEVGLIIAALLATRDDLARAAPRGE